MLEKSNCRFAKHAMCLSSTIATTTAATDAKLHRLCTSPDDTLLTCLFSPEGTLNRKVCWPWDAN